MMIWENTRDISNFMTRLVSSLQRVKYSVPLYWTQVDESPVTQIVSVHSNRSCRNLTLLIMKQFTPVLYKNSIIFMQRPL